MMKINSLNWIAALCAVVLLGSCDNSSPDPNEEMNNKIQGEWDVDSFTQDGVEAVGYFYTSFEMEFKAESSVEGETEWTRIKADGTIVKEKTGYKISNDGQTIKIDDSNLNILFRGNILVLSGNIDGFRVEIEATK